MQNLESGFEWFAEGRGLHSLVNSKNGRCKILITTCNAATCKRLSQFGDHVRCVRLTVTDNERNVMPELMARRASGRQSGEAPALEALEGDLQVWSVARHYKIVRHQRHL